MARDQHNTTNRVSRAEGGEGGLMPLAVSRAPPPESTPETQHERNVTGIGSYRLCFQDKPVTFIGRSRKAEVTIWQWMEDALTHGPDL